MKHTELKECYWSCLAIVETINIKILMVRLQQSSLKIIRNMVSSGIKFVTAAKISTIPVQKLSLIYYNLPNRKFCY